MVAGCSQSNALTAREVATYESQGFGLDAALQGALVRENGCLYITNNGYRTLPVFPSDSVRWDGEVLRFGSDSYRLGDAVVVGGGEAGPPGRFEIPEACAVDAARWLVAPPGT
jgi:hypothetical protein